MRLSGRVWKRGSQAAYINLDRIPFFLTPQQRPSPIHRNDNTRHAGTAPLLDEAIFADRTGAVIVAPFIEPAGPVV